MRCLQIWKLSHHLMSIDPTVHTDTRKHTPELSTRFRASLGDCLLIGNPGVLFVSRGPEIPFPSLRHFLFFQFTFGRGNLCLSCSLVISHSTAGWARRLRVSTWQCMESAYQRVRGLKLSVSCELLAYWWINLFDQTLLVKPQSFGWGIMRRHAHTHIHTHTHTHTHTSPLPLSSSCSNLFKVPLDLCLEDVL